MARLAGERLVERDVIAQAAQHARLKRLEQEDAELARQSLDAERVAAVATAREAWPPRGGWTSSGYRCAAETFRRSTKDTEEYLHKDDLLLARAT